MMGSEGFRSGNCDATRISVWTQVRQWRQSARAREQQGWTGSHRSNSQHLQPSVPEFSLQQAQRSAPYQLIIRPWRLRRLEIAIDNQRILIWLGPGFGSIKGLFPFLASGAGSCREYPAGPEAGP